MVAAEIEKVDSLSTATLDVGGSGNMGGGGRCGSVEIKLPFGAMFSLIFLYSIQG